MSVFKKYFGWLLVLVTACTSPSYTPPENALDAGRQFIDAVYKGNFKRAEDLVLPTEQNKNLLAQRLEEPYHQRTSTDRNVLAQASLQILEIDNQAKDSVLFIHFFNLYTNQPAILKVVKNGAAWLVDLPFSFPAGK